MLTADTNIIHLAAFATYRITEPITFYFDFADAAAVCHQRPEQCAAVRRQPFHRGRHSPPSTTAFREAVEARMRELVEQQDLGITVDRVDSASSPPVALVE